MDFGYDIFRKLDDGTPMWVTQVGSLDDGKNLIHTLSSATPGAYFIRDASTGKIIFNSGGVPAA